MLGIAAGLLVGKPVGIWLTSFAAIKLKVGALPDGTGWKHLAGIGKGGDAAFFNGCQSVRICDFQKTGEDEAELKALRRAHL